MRKLLVRIGLATLVAGCANSASHEVASASTSIDSMMTCSDIRTEFMKVNLIKEGVQKDKDDITGKDVVDGILWFPFNVLAKQANYSNANEAADKRIQVLKAMAYEQNCDLNSKGVKTTEASDAQERLRNLAGLKKDGLISDEEYLEKRKAILGGL